MHETKVITAKETFLGAADVHGTIDKVYEKGKTYEVPANMASVFVGGGLAKHAPGKPVDDDDMTENDPENKTEE